MKKKLTTLLFGLLLAVGWTSNASAQSLTKVYKGANAPLRADRAYTDMVTLTADEAAALEYTWTDSEGSHTSKATDVATKPEQIYELLRFVYMNPAFPGPSYSAWNANDLALSSFPNRVDPVYYGGIGGGWDIGASYTAVPNQNLTITFSSSTVNFDYIELIGDGAVIDRWDYTNGNTFPNGWSCNRTLTTSNNGFCYFADSYYYSSGGTITINSSRFSSGNYRSVRVIVHACNDANSTGTINCAGFTQTPYTPAEIQELDKLDSTPSVKQALRDYGWTITGTETLAADGTYTPSQEGYTALVVSVKNDADIYDEPQSYLGSCSFYSKAEVIEWISKTIDQVKLLTDGLLIGVQGDYTRGTVFNCDGRYNKFFFLSKGQARKKSTQVNTWISNGTYPGYIGEEVAFKEMFEEFSPTAGGAGDQIDNFYSKMMEGSVYDIVHDCASVIQNGHQFSMSGNTGETYYAMSGLNFFIPDYRLAMWWNPATINGSTRQYVDGRSFVPYQYYNTSGRLVTDDGASYWSAYYAQYNPKYAPKVGIYRISLHAEADPVAYDYQPGNRNYKVTLTWVSSLNEMSGHNVPQTYTVYYYDENGQRQKLVVEGYTNTDGETGLTTLVYYVEQFEHSYNIDYIVMGTPDDTEHPDFIAWSNEDGVTIPGWDDFLILKLDHHESDYVAADRANWYRNFLHVDNDVFNGLSLTKVTSGMDEFNLYRTNSKDASEKKIATLKFDQATEEKVHYTVTYDDGQQILETPKYTRSAMKIPDEGYVRVRGNGDIIIQPNGYHVNFKSITVKNNGTVITGNTWTSNQSSLPGNWILSPGSLWEKYAPTGNYYLEGGGYIAIPGILNNSNYTNVTVEIVGYGDGSSVAKVAVNDNNKTFDNNSSSPSTYTWNVSTSRGTSRAGEVETVTEGFEDQSLFPPFSTGGITAENHYGLFGDWRLYDSTGGEVWGVDGTTFTNEGQPHAWFVFNATIAGAGIDSHNGDQYLESICPIPTSEGGTFDGPADHWLISPVLSGNEQTITFWERTLSETYGNEEYEVLASTTDNNPSSFTSVKKFADATLEWTERSATLPAGTKYFAIRHYSNDIFGVLIDDITYERPAGGETPVIEGDNLRLGNLPIVDQLKEPILDDNSHPDSYYYVLRYEPNGPTGEGVKKTGTVQVDIEKTQVKVNGNHTQADIDDDIDAKLEMDIISADVTMDLRESDPYILYYQMQGKANGDPEHNKDWLTQLQQMTSGSYMEMFSGAQSEPLFEQTCPAEIHHYFVDDFVNGTYDQKNFFTYAPSVSTWGIHRRYYETDGKDNTYGGPIWKTGAGKAEVKSVTLEKQVANDGSALSSVSWLDGNDQPCSLYILDNIMADGYLPSSDVTNIEYVPYMFRIYVESPTGMLRGFIPPVPGTTTNPGTNAQNDPSFNNFNGPWCVYEENVEDAQVVDLEGGKGVVWQKMKDDSDWANNAVFGALSSMIQGTQNSATFNPDDLTVYVRFYYMVKDSNAKNRAGEARPGNGSQSPGFEPSPWTAVGEIKYVGDVVSVTYVNPLGMTSDRPFDGINIVLTRYSNGTTSTSKVMY
jgi:hypothetical protein